MFRSNPSPSKNCGQIFEQKCKGELVFLSLGTFAVTYHVSALGQYADLRMQFCAKNGNLYALSKSS